MVSSEKGEAVPPNEVDRDDAAPSAHEPLHTPQGEGSKAPGGKVVDWLLARTELAQARAAASEFTSEQREFLRRAKLALELGELAYAPGNTVRSGSTAPLATNLFRQAVYWALLSQRPKGDPISPEQLWSETDRSVLQSVAGNDGEYAYLSVVMRSTFVELAEGTEEAQRTGAAQLRNVAKRVVSNAQGVIWRFEWAKVKRVLRVGLVLLVPVAAVIALWPEKRDLAKGVPWHVSSSAAECHPDKHECGEVKTDILFHTALEKNPWFEYDFGAPIAFSSLTIKNRSDYGQDRTVPLVVEVSNDDKSFTEVAKREAVFDVWKPSFPTQHARYLRLRIPRDSMLHLEAIKVHP
ncbi:MAG TPA: discoidin domain-containing protein [Polyangiaceae bacterium]|nr:discoidin domain-containing protein [Polyangiaceae bacterium]